MKRQNNTITNEEITKDGQGGFIGVAYILNLVFGFLLTILGLRFVFMLFGANPANPIANFVYTVSQPFVTPFFGLFNYQPQLGVGRFEFETLIAIIVYGLLASVILGAFTRRTV